MVVPIKFTKDVDSAYEHLNAGHDKFQILNVPHSEITSYRSAHLNKLESIKIEQPFNELDVKLTCWHKVDDFFTKNKTRFDRIRFPVALTISTFLTFYFFPHLFFRGGMSAQTFFREWSTTPSSSTWYLKLPFNLKIGAAFYNRKMAPFLGRSFNPTSIQIATGIISGLLAITSIALFIFAFRAPLNRSGLHTLTFTADHESRKLTNARDGENYICPISGKKILKLGNGFLPIRFENQIFDSAAWMRYWLENPEPLSERTLSEQESSMLRKQAAKVFEISECDISAAINCNSTPLSAADRAIDPQGNFKAFAYDFLKLTEMHTNKINAFSDEILTAV